MNKPLFTKVLQIGFVVSNCENTAMIYAKKYGIGPWSIYGPDCMKNIIQYGEQYNMKIKVASTYLNGIELELIEPLDNKSIYSDFLLNHGEGLHHLALENNFNRTINFAKKENIPIILSGTFGIGEDFAYINASQDLKCIIELYNSQPNSSYPSPFKVID